MEKKEETIGIHIDYVFQITNEHTGNKVINPAIEAMQRNQVVLLAKSYHSENEKQEHCIYWWQWCSYP